jgi:hypothetical protein
MQALETVPILSGPFLHARPAPTPDEAVPSDTEAVNLMIEEISTEALMRIFDSLPTDYRISVCYVARVVRIESRGPSGPPVTDAEIDLGVPT